MTKRTIRKRLDEILYEEMLNNFLKGEYQEGEEFNIAEIAASFGVSITPLTIAMKRMYYENIIDRTPGGKYLVPKRTRESIEQLCDVRYMLEEKSLLHLLRSDPVESAKVVSSLEECARECFDFADASDIVNSIRKDRRLHSILVNAYGNQYISLFYTQIRNKMMCWSYTKEFTSGHQKAAVSEHFQIIDAINSRDEARAKSLLFRHVDEVRRRLSASLD